MSAIIIPFRSKAEIECGDNLKAFVAYARTLPVFGHDLDFDQDEWPVRGHILGERHEGQCISFSVLGAGRGRRTYMADPFKTFAKAYFRYNYGLRPNRNSATFLLAVLRCLEKALSEESDLICISEASGHTFDRAAQIVKGKFSHPYYYGGLLERIAADCDEHHLARAALDWANPFRKEASASVRVHGEAAAQIRSDRLPDEEAIYAIADIFHRAEAPVDLIISSIVAILFSAPDRIGEVLNLPYDCEVEEGGRYGLRWFPEKGGRPTVKWVLPSMRDVIREAVRRLQVSTEPARQVARWYEAHPRELYLPPGTEHLRAKQQLSTREVGMICGYASGTAAEQHNLGASWCKKVLKLTPTFIENGKKFLYDFKEVEAALIAQLPPGFPIFDKETGVRFSESLCIIRPNELAPSRCTIPCLVDRIGQNQTRVQLGGLADVESIFDRFGFRAKDGSRLKLQTHQVRRLLNTMGQKAGLDPLDIALWSGRKRPEQNAAYDYVTSAEIMATLRKLAESTDDGHLVLGPMDEISRNAPMSRAEFFAMAVPQAHTTDFGFCVRDFSMLPCQVHQDCINCQEHLICKGDKRQYGNTCKRLEETEVLLEKAKNGVARDIYGADQWSRHQMMSANRLRQMKSIHEDPKIEDGTVVQLGPPKAVWDNSSGAVRPSEIRNAIEQRAEEDPEIAALRDNLVWG